MELCLIQTYQSPVIEEFTEQLQELNLVSYASEAAAEMEFEDIEEFHEAVKRAMELCLHAQIPLAMHFKRIYKSSVNGIVYDWKLSSLGYKLVCLNGGSSNPLVARMQIELLKSACT